MPKNIIKGLQENNIKNKIYKIWNHFYVRLSKPRFFTSIIIEVSKFGGRSEDVVDLITIKRSEKNYFLYATCLTIFKTWIWLRFFNALHFNVCFYFNCKLSTISLKIYKYGVKIWHYLEKLNSIIKKNLRTSRLVIWFRSTGIRSWEHILLSE